MKLKEQLKAKKDALKALEDRIKAEDAEAIKEAAELSDAIDALEKSIADAKKAAEKLAKIGTDEDPDAKGGEPEGLKSLDLESLKNARGTVSTYIKAYNDAEAMGDNKIITYDQNVVSVMPKLGVRDLFGAESISGNALTYYVLSDAEGTIDGTSEGAAKDRIHIPYTPKTAALAKIAAYLKETDELLSDAAFLESAIKNRGVYEFNKAVEAYLVSALLNTSGIQSGDASISFDGILKGKHEVMADTGYTPDAILINPADLQDLLLTKDGGSTGQYLMGGPAYAPYGNGSYGEYLPIWGMKVVESIAVPEGICVVGAFKAAASVVTKANEGQRIEVSNSDQDDFIKNMITIRIEERLVEAVRVPAAFCVVGTEES